MPAIATCEAEVRRLHDCFVEWYCATIDTDQFSRIERALAPAFERVAPDGQVADRKAVVEVIREAYDTHDAGTFDIEIRNVELIEQGENCTLVRYEEWQTSDSGSNGRISTALFTPTQSDREPLASWEYVHETWLDPPGE